jgi:hypothetical protein
MATIRTGSAGWRRNSRLAASLVGAALLAAVVAAAYAQGRAAGSRHAIVGAFGVGGVLTADGALWQYRPDKGDWITIDQAFAADGKTTKILPLPVDGTDVAYMESFGFLVTRSGVCWLYDLENNRWQNIGRPAP